MFYCDPCADKNGWPRTAFKSRGRCEDCGQQEICNDMPSSSLPFSAPTESIHAPDSPPAEPEEATCACKGTGKHYIFHSEESCGITPLPAAELPVEQSAASTIREGVDRLRAIPGAWKEREDPLADLQAIHEGRLHDVAPDPRPVHREEPLGDNESSRRVAAVKGACARAAGFSKDAVHGYSGQNAESWEFGWEYCNDCLRDPGYHPPSIDTREPAELPGKELPPFPNDDELVRIAFEVFPDDPGFLRTVWKDGIDIQAPTVQYCELSLRLTKAVRDRLAAALQKIEELQHLYDESMRVVSALIIQKEQAQTRAELAESQLSERDRVIGEAITRISQIFQYEEEVQPIGEDCCGRYYAFDGQLSL